MIAVIDERGAYPEKTFKSRTSLTSVHLSTRRQGVLGKLEVQAAVS
jgi:hypothetical protein